MGYGDEIIGTGLARGAKARGKRIAFGDGKKIDWGGWCEEMFRNNPNIAKPGSEGQSDLEWINHCKGARLYNSLDRVNRRWIWNYDFKVKPGQFYFNQNEKDFASSFAKNFIVIEPNVPWQKEVASNKDWGEQNYRTVASALKKSGYRMIQFKHKNSRRILSEAQIVETVFFREVIAALSRASLYIGPEGGMHHAAAAVGVSAVVLFGGFIPPEVMGYDNHTCLTGGVKACGNVKPCKHCHDAMNSITAQQVIDAAERYLQ